MKNDLTPPSAIVIGGSAGSIPVLNEILSSLQESYPVPIIVCLHRMKTVSEGIRELLSMNYNGDVIEPDDKTPVINGNVYVAPSNYHMLISDDRCICLSTEEPVNFSRPSIDVTLKSAAKIYRQNLTGILLSGANRDGAEGMRNIKKNNGITIVQHPLECSAPFMPMAALETASVDHVLRTAEIILYLKKKFNH